MGHSCQKGGLCLEGGFPGGPGVKNLPSGAGAAGSIPDWGTEIPHGQQSLHAATAEPQLESLCHK